VVHRSGSGNGRSLARSRFVAVLALSPLGGVGASRKETPHSNAERGSLYAQVLEELKESPVVGFGAPRATDDGPPQCRVPLFEVSTNGPFMWC
jgi:hypothetical protein